MEEEESFQSLPPSPKPTLDYSSAVDTSRPFRSVKEAVAIFGDRLLTGEIYSAQPPPSRIFSFTFSPPPPPSPPPTHRNPRENDDHRAVIDSLKKLESELKETKTELKLLKERESETEVALASLNAELHKNMSKLAEAEAKAAAKAVAKAVATRSSATAVREEERRRDMAVMRRESMPTLAEILSIGEKQGYFGGKKSNERKKMKKKPIIPLVGDLFFRKKNSPADNFQNPLCSSKVLF